MRSIRDMEKEAARVAALSPEARAVYNDELAVHRAQLGFDQINAALLDVTRIGDQWVIRYRGEGAELFRIPGWMPAGHIEHMLGPVTAALNDAFVRGQACGRRDLQDEIKVLLGDKIHRAFDAATLYRPLKPDALDRGEPT